MAHHSFLAAETKLVSPSMVALDEKAREAKHERAKNTFDFSIGSRELWLFNDPESHTSLHSAFLMDFDCMRSTSGMWNERNAKEAK